MTTPQRPHRNFYGRIKGKALKSSQKTYLDEDLAALSPGVVSWDDNPERTPLDLQTRFDGKPVWLEIGFGGGEHLVHQAASNADVGIIGSNALIAENGYSLLVTNEGNGDLCANLPNVLIVCTTIDRVQPTAADAAALLRLLVRSATGQSQTC